MLYVLDWRCVMSQSEAEQPTELVIVESDLDARHFYDEYLKTMKPNYLEDVTKFFDEYKTVTWEPKEVNFLDLLDSIGENTTGLIYGVFDDSMLATWWNCGDSESRRKKRNGYKMA